MEFLPLPTYPNDGDNSLSVEDYLSHDGGDCALPFTGDDFVVVPPEGEGEGIAGNTDLSEYWRTSLPLGMRFRPRDEELVTYLQLQSVDPALVTQGIIVTNVDVYDYEPHHLPSLAIDFGDGKMYFFTYVKKIGKNKTERRIRTRTGCHWKATQAPKEVIASSSGETVGYKMPLAYYEEGKKKTQWLMQEYKLTPYESEAPKEYELVLAVVYYHHRKRRRDED